MMASSLFADEALTNERRRVLSPAARNVQISKSHDG